MAYFEDVNTREQVTGDIDSFGRKRVSEVTTQFDAKQIHDNLPLFIDGRGTGSDVYDNTTAKTTISTAGSGDYFVKQTKQRFNYQTGKSMEFFWTFFDFSEVPGVTKRVGYFNSSTVAPYDTVLDGFWLESDGTTLRLKVYRSGVEVRNVARVDWDDSLDGSGDSGVIHDFGNNTILNADIEWLGVGGLRFFIVKNKARIQFHQMDFTDEDEVFISSPNQPMRWEIRQNDVTSGSFSFICGTVGAEGGINRLGKLFSDNLGTTHINANSTSNKYALIGIRLKASQVDTLIDLLTLSVLSLTNDSALWEVWLNPTVAGTFTYNDVTDSSIQVAKGDPGGTNTVTGGYLLDSGYLGSESTDRLNIESAIRLGMSIDGTLDEIVLTAQPLSSNLDILGSLTWRELV